MKDAEFAKRLNQACDKDSGIPPLYQGRQTWIQHRMGVSHEAVRKWFSGDSRPRPNKMRELATLLKVDEAWLGLGLSPDENRGRDLRVRNTKMSGSVNLVMGMMQLAGGHCAVPDNKDPRGTFVDFYCVLHGTQNPIHVSLARTVNLGEIRFTIPAQYDQCRVVGVVQTAQTGFDLLDLTSELVRARAENKGGYLELAVTVEDNQYRSGEAQVHRIRDFRDS